nr:NADH dehydrogenase [ubiquinone] 1 beta subcomplex subunit 9-like [Saimiri boliviensis boliviensis]
MAFSEPAAYVTHQQKVVRFFKELQSHLKSWCVHRDKYRCLACLMGARLEEHKNEKDMIKATQMLREAEEDLWYREHSQPYIFPDSPGGSSYKRHECYKVPENCLDAWHPSQRAMYPDYFAKRERGRNCGEKAGKEIKQLEEETPPGGPLTEALPPARKEGDLPPLWWHIVTRPQERQCPTGPFLRPSRLTWSSWTCGSGLMLCRTHGTPRGAEPKAPLNPERSGF